MAVLTDVTKLTTLTSLTLLFHTGLEAFSVFHVVLNIPTKYLCGYLRTVEMPPLVRNEDRLLINRVYPQLLHAYADINVTENALVLCRPTT
jgi:hypothetical protein